MNPHGMDCQCLEHEIERLRAENERLQAEIQTFADAWNELETLQAKVAVLEKEKASWGNEFTAVYMAKERIEELKKALRFCRDNNFKIEKTQEVARNALLSSALEKVNANYSGVLGSLVDENFNRSDGRELEQLREENERLKAEIKKSENECRWCKQEFDGYGACDCASDAYKGSANAHRFKEARIAKLEALLREARERLKEECYCANVDTEIVECDCCTTGKRIDAALEKK